MPRMTPVNMSVEGVHAAAGVPASQPMPAVPSADELDNWAQDNYSVSIIQPELLATTVFSHKEDNPGEAIGSVYGLHAIADGATLAHALDKL